MERVIITGGTGLIGSHLAQALASAGYQVAVLSRNPSKNGTMPEGIRMVRWDAESAKGWGDLADGALAIVNLAGENIGEGRWTREKKRRIVQSRLNAGKAVVEAVERASQKPQVVLQASGVDYYGARGDEIVTEETPPGRGFLSEVCERWEASTASVEQMGVRQVVLRSGIVLSPEGGALARLLPPFRFFVGGPLGSGQQWWPWIHLRDEVAAIRFLMEHEIRGPFNLATPNPVTNAEFGRILGRVLHRPAVFPAPGFALRILLGEMATMILDGKRVIPARLQEAGFDFQFPRLEPALRDLLVEGPAR